MDAFWPDADPEAARRNLHQAIYALRQTMNPEGSDFPHIQLWNDCYRLNPALDIWLDCEEFEQHFQAGQRLELNGAIERAMIEYGIAEGLYQDDFLVEDLYEEWCQSHRRYLCETFLSVGLRLASYYLERQEYAASIAMSRRILARDNCQEKAHQNLIRCFLAQGQPHLALSQYQNCVQTLEEELGLPPSEETGELLAEITRGKG
jgi:DNA-binding SARP family transcriptional activator